MKLTIYPHHESERIVKDKIDRGENIQAWIRSAIVLAHKYGKRMEEFVKQEPNGLTTKDIDRFYAAVERLEMLRMTNVHIPGEINSDVEDILNMYEC